MRRAAAAIAFYLLALAVLCWLARGLSFPQVCSDLGRANLILFFGAVIISFALYLFGDTLMYAWLVTFFHAPATFAEMLPGAALNEFLQVVNGIAAGSSLAWFVHIRKRVDWLSAGCTLAVLGFIDLQAMALMLLLFCHYQPKSPLAIPWPGPVIFIGASLLFAGFWMRGRPRTRFARWLYDRPCLAAFRQIRLHHYFLLGFVRTSIIAAQGVTLWLEMTAFGLHVPLLIVMAISPIILFASALPYAPSGLGARQAATVIGFSAFGSRSSLLSMSLAHSSLVIALRLMLGLFVSTTLLRAVIRRPQPISAPAGA